MREYHLPDVSAASQQKVQNCFKIASSPHHDGVRIQMVLHELDGALVVFLVESANVEPNTVGIKTKLSAGNWLICKQALQHSRVKQRFATVDVLELDTGQLVKPKAGEEHVAHVRRVIGQFQTQSFALSPAILCQMNLFFYKSTPKKPFLLM